jgi:hypothetical protein
MEASSSRYNLFISVLSIFLLFAGADLAAAKSYLFYLEAQGVAGYSTEQEKPIYYSMSQEDVMQKPGLGFDYLQRLSGETGDYGALAIQARLAFNATGEQAVQPQLYNAYFKYKARVADLWVGHNRPALGISSYLDSHALLLPTFGMLGFAGYDRDWGVGSYRDFSWGNLALSATTASGFPIYFKGNYMLAGRISRGVLAQDNYNFGVSAAYGKNLETVGYELIDPQPTEMSLVGADLAYLWNRLENRFDLFAGRKLGHAAYALMWRIGVNFLEEDRLKIEVQPVYWEIGNDWNYQLYAGITFKATSDLTPRVMYVYDRQSNDQRVLLQLYWYHLLF